MLKTGALSLLPMFSDQSRKTKPNINNQGVKYILSTEVGEGRSDYLLNSYLICHNLPYIQQTACYAAKGD